MFEEESLELLKTVVFRHVHVHGDVGVDICRQHFYQSQSLKVGSGQDAVCLNKQALVGDRIPQIDDGAPWSISEIFALRACHDVEEVRNSSSRSPSLQQ